jgi:hypothetical protein
MTSFKTILAVFGLFVVAACEMPDHAAAPAGAHTDGGGMMNDGEVMEGGDTGIMSGG